MNAKDGCKHICVTSSRRAPLGERKQAVSLAAESRTIWEAIAQTAEPLMAAVFCLCLCMCACVSQANGFTGDGVGYLLPCVIECNDYRCCVM